MRKNIVIIGSICIIALGTGGYFLHHSMKKSEPQVVNEVVVENNNNNSKNIQFISKEKIEEATGMQLTIDTAATIATELEKETTWKSIGTDDTKISAVINRVKNSKEQTIGILKSISNNNGLQLKIIMLENGEVNLGKEYINSTQYQNSNQQINSQAYNSSQIEKFQIEVEYTNGDYEIEYKNNSHGYNAKIDDELQGIKIEGQEAINQIESVVLNLPIDTTTNAKDMFTIVDNAFPTKGGWKKYKIEVEFIDGTKIEYTY